MVQAPDCLILTHYFATHPLEYAREKVIFPRNTSNGCIPEVSSFGTLPKRKPGTLRFAFAGDLCLPPNPSSDSKHASALDCLKLIRPSLQEVDFGVVNFEGPVVAAVTEKRLGVTVHLRNDPAALQVAASSGFNVLNLANNHIMDFGPAALAHTLELIKQNGLNALGAGKNTLTAERPLRLTCRGWKVGFLSFTTDETSVRSILASNEAPGCASLKNLPAVLEKISNLHREVDLVCVQLHWGHEYYLYPTSEQVALARRMVDAGAKLVVGHHPHVVQGLELYNGGIIAYSLGNLFFPKLRNENGRMLWEKPITRQSLVLAVDVDEQKHITLSLIPGLKRSESTLVPYDHRGITKFRDYFAGLCTPLARHGYPEWYRAYAINRKRELQRQSALEAVLKALHTPFPELVRSLRPQDFRRNLARVLGQEFRP